MMISDAILAMAIVYAVLVVAGCTTNLLIVIATIRSKNLHNCCNILIALCALSDILHILGQIPKIIPIFIGTLKITTYTCSILQIIPSLGLNAGVIIVLLIAIDRFLAVYLQGYYLTKDPRRYLMASIRQASGHGFAIFLYDALHYASAYFYFESEKGIVICSPPEMYRGIAQKFWASITFTVIALSVIVYYAVWQRLKHATSFSQDRRTFRSIFAVMCVIILGWFLTMAIFNFVRAGLHLQGRELDVGSEISGIFVNTAVSLNCLVLYFTSNDYRRAFRQQLRLIPFIGRLFPPEVVPRLSTMFETSGAIRSLS